MDSGLDIKDSKRKMVIIKSFLWNSIIEVMKERKNIDISSYLISISWRSDTFFIKTNNPLINGELLLLDTIIKELFIAKLQKVHIKGWNIHLKYI